MSPVSRMRIAIALLVLGSVGGTPVRADASPAWADLAVESDTLRNGLRVVLHPCPAPLVSVNVSIHAGSKDDPPDRRGLAHLVEHLMFQGGVHLGSDVFAALRDLSATRANATTDYDRTTYYYDIPPGALEFALWMEADRLGFTADALTDSILSREVAIVEAERRQEHDDQPYGTLDAQLDRLMYPPGHPYAWDVIGARDDLRQVSLEDVRSFLRAHYVPDNATLVIAGAFDPAQARAWVERYFASLEPGGPRSRLERLVPALDGDRVASVTERVPSPRVLFAWHSPPYLAPQDADLDLAATILADWPSSVLHRRLVDELGIAREVNAYQDSREIAGLFVIDVTAASEQSLDRIAAVVEEEVARLASAPPSEADLVRAKANYAEAFRSALESIGDLGGRADLLASYTTYLDSPDRVGWDLARYERATGAGIQDATRRWLSQPKGVLRITPLAWSAEASALDRSVRPSVGPVANAGLPAPEETTLPNGLRIVAAHVPGPSVIARLVIDTGPLAAAATGTAVLASWMLTDGTRDRAGESLAARLDELPTTIDANVRPEAIVVSMDAPAAHAADGLALLAELVGHAAFPAAYQRAREQLLAQIDYELADPPQLGMHVLPALVFGSDHPYGQPLTGSARPKSVADIDREALVAFHARFFRPERATLVLVGDMPPADLIDLARARFDAWSGSRFDEPMASAPPFEPHPTTVHVVDRPGAAQSLVACGLAVPGWNSPERVALEALHMVLGGAFTSRLNRTFREERGHAYGAGSMFLPYREAGLFLVYAPVPISATRETVRDLVHAFEELGSTAPPTAAELEAAERAITLARATRCATQEGVASLLCDLTVQRSTAAALLQDQEGLRELTVDSLGRIAHERLRPDSLAVLVIGDWSQLRKELDPIGLPTVSVEPWVDADAASR